MSHSAKPTQFWPRWHSSIAPTRSSGRRLPGVRERCQLQVMDYLEQRLGVDGLLNGQSLDLNYSACPTTAKPPSASRAARLSHSFVSPWCCPPCWAALPPAKIRLLERIAVCWGLGYQIVDDLKDVLQSATETGKPQRATFCSTGQISRPRIGIAGRGRAPRHASCAWEI